jgi:hypothetical protein
LIVHWPETQAAKAFGLAQLRPQPPQLDGSLVGSTHLPLHTTDGAGQSISHLPATQRAPDPHAWKHEPQLFCEVLRFSHPRAQAV